MVFIGFNLFSFLCVCACKGFILSKKFPHLLTWFVKNDLTSSFHCLVLQMFMFSFAVITHHDQKQLSGHTYHRGEGSQDRKSRQAHGGGNWSLGQMLLMTCSLWLVHFALLNNPGSPAQGDIFSCGLDRHINHYLRKCPLDLCLQAV